MIFLDLESYIVSVSIILLGVWLDLMIIFILILGFEHLPIVAMGPAIKTQLFINGLIDWFLYCHTDLMGKIKVHWTLIESIRVRRSKV